MEAAKLYEELIQWGIAYIDDYNPVVKLKDGYLTTFTESLDITHDAASVIELKKFCTDRNIEFIYINLPTKICKYEDSDVSGVLDFANQNTDRLLKKLGEAGIKYYDFREILHNEGMNHHEAFYRTDHHWKAETGLWASKKILEFLRDDYGWQVDPDVLNPENFESVVYHNGLLGSQGRKFTLARIQPEDIALIYPKYKTLIEYEIPDIGINISGDFAVTYDMRGIDNKNYYGHVLYETYYYGNHPLRKIRNLLTCCDKKLLIVHDSFFNCVIPFIMSEIKEIDSIHFLNNVYYFKGSLQSYIKQNKPDLLIFTCYSAVPGAKKNKAFYLR